MCISKILSWFQKPKSTSSPKSTNSNPVVDPIVDDKNKVNNQNEEPVETPAKVLNPRVLSLLWNIENLPSSQNAAQFYPALNLRVKTTDYKDGENVEIKIQNKSEKPLSASLDSLSLSGKVVNNEVVFKDLFKNVSLNIDNSPDFCLKAIAIKDNVNSFVSHGRPSWAAVYEGYPKINAGTPSENDQPAYEVFESIFGEGYDNSLFSNACATRVSIALNHAKVPVKADFKIQIGNYKGKGIITSAAKLKNWLSLPEVLGKADIIIKNPQSFDELSSVLGAKKGLYILESDNYNWATGHATLWYDGHALGNHDYYSHAKEIHFWELI